MALPPGTNGNLLRDKMMSIPANICLFIFTGLLMASMVMQWVRAKKRRHLVRIVDVASLLPADQQKWYSIEKSFDFMFKDFRKLQIVKKNAGRFSDEFRAELRRYRQFSRIELLITSSMLLFASIAFSICR